MSSYILLRNNKESGPFSIDEIKGMSLKTYDLLWVVGKSAAWQYPGEIQELKPFAPPVPELPSNPFAKSDNEKFTRSVYVNLPAEKNQANRSKIMTAAIPLVVEEPESDFSEIYHRGSSDAARFSGKLLWVSTIALLFGAGILTGLFISDRRKFFSNEADHLQRSAINHPAAVNLKEDSKILIPVSQHDLPAEESFVKQDNVESVVPVVRKLSAVKVKKAIKAEPYKQDSSAHFSETVLSKIADNPGQMLTDRSDPIYNKIKTHPENYLNLVTGTYSTGLLGGISSFPVLLTNNSPIVMDLVVVSVQYIQNNNKIYKTENLSFTDLQPGEIVSLKAPKSPRGTKVAARIHAIDIHQLGVNYSN